MNITDALLSYPHQNISRIIIRNGEVVSNKGIFTKIARWFRDVYTVGFKGFFDSKGIVDRLEFEALYQELKERVRVVDKRFQNKDFSKETFELVKSLLKIDAVIQLSSIRETLSCGQSEAYSTFQNDISRIQGLAKKHLKKCPDFQLKRWMASNLKQRLFAVYRGESALPFKMSEVPVGSVLLLKTKRYLDRYASQKRIPNRIGKDMKLLQKFIYKTVFKTDVGYIHTEFKFEPGKIFHVTSKNEGKAEIKDVDEDFVLSSYEVFTPERDELLKASDKPSQSYGELIGKVTETVRKKGPGIRLTFQALLKVAFNRKRRDDYRLQDALQTDKRKYVCSTSVASFFADCGVDLGKQLDVTPEKVYPEQFSKMSSFSEAKESNMQDYEAMQNLKELLHHGESNQSKYLSCIAKVKKKGFLTKLLMEIYRGLSLKSASPLHAAKMHLTDDLVLLKQAIKIASA